MVSLQNLNVIINLFILLSNGILARMLESIYVFIAKIQLRRKGRTHATDSSETDIFQWPRAKIAAFFGRNNQTRTTRWVFILLFVSLAFIPCELYVETGIEPRQNCGPEHQLRKGVSATPWGGHSDVGIACSALVVERFTWIDDGWDIVYEGSSPNMIPTEVHRQDVAGQDKQNRVPLAQNCKVQVSKCEDCGTMTVGKDGGAFDTIITDASIADDVDADAVDEVCPRHEAEKGRYKPFRGDLTYDFATGMAFYFWAMPCKRVGTLEQEPSRAVYRLRTKGVEILLSEAEEKKVLEGSSDPWKLELESNRTRLYDITCESPGMGWRDLMKATSLYRTIQMEQPGMQRTGVSKLEDVSPLNRSNVLQALFALKAEDVNSELYERLVPTYTECGAFKWRKAWPSIGVIGAIFLIFVVLSVHAIFRGTISTPHNAASWRRVAIGESDVNVFLKSDRNVDDVWVEWPKRQFS